MAKFENGNKSNDNDRIHEYDNCTLLYSAVCLVLVVNHSITVLYCTVLFVWF